MYGTTCGWSPTPTVESGPEPNQCTSVRNLGQSLGDRACPCIIPEPSECSELQVVGLMIGRVSSPCSPSQLHRTQGCLVGSMLRLVSIDHDQKVDMLASQQLSHMGCFSLPTRHPTGTKRAACLRRIVVSVRFKRPTGDGRLLYWVCEHPTCCRGPA